MLDPKQPFKYKLDPILRRERWDGEVLGAEAARARAVEEDKRRLLDQVAASIRAAEAELRALHRANEPIPLERRQLLTAFLQHQHVQAALRAQELAQAEQIHREALAALQAKRRSTRALENHRDRRKSEHDVEQTRQSLKRADESWLLRRGRET